MSEFIVNDANFVIDMDDGIRDDLLAAGEILPGGCVIEKLIDRAHNFQIYEVEDGQVLVLAVKEALLNRWVQDGYISASAFMRYEAASGPVYLLLSPSSLIMDRVTALRAYGSLRYALNFAAALQYSRTLDQDISFRDGIYVELFSVVLPTYSKVRAVCDHALFLNVLSKDQNEDLSSRAEMSPSEINFYVVAADLRRHGFRLPDVEPYLHSAEEVEATDFDHPRKVAGVVALSENYQLYALTDEYFLLLLEPRWARELIEDGLLEAWDLLNLRVGGTFVRALLLSKRQPVESLGDRHFGLDLNTALRLAVALKGSAAKVPAADFAHGLYLAAKKVVLPDDGSATTDPGVLYNRIINEGPFANAPFDYPELAALNAAMNS